MKIQLEAEEVIACREELKRVVDEASDKAYRLQPKAGTAIDISDVVAHITMAVYMAKQLGLPAGSAVAYAVIIEEVSEETNESEAAERDRQDGQG